MKLILYDILRDSIEESYCVFYIFDDDLVERVKSVIDKAINDDYDEKLYYDVDDVDYNYKSEFIKSWSSPAIVRFWVNGVKKGAIDKIVGRMMEIFDKQGIFLNKRDYNIL